MRLPAFTGIGSTSDPSDGIEVSSRPYPAPVTTSLLRLLITGWILVMLVRAARAAWRQRDLLVTVWRSIRPRHVAGAVGLLAVVATIATVLIGSVPGMAVGLGDLIGFTGNAVFVPLEEAAARAGPVPDGGTDLVVIGLATVFLGGLAALLPWLAFVEEEVFRAGLEDVSLGRELVAALIFGLAHLVMLVPVGAAVAIGAAGFVYGRIYRGAHARLDGHAVPPAAARAFRATKRSAAAADRARGTAAHEASSGETTLVAVVDRAPERRQAAAVLASTVWHTTFNTLVVALVWLSIVLAAL